MATTRPAREVDLDRLAHIWHDGWRDAHLAIVPAALARLRTYDSFRERLRAALSRVIVAENDGSPVGFAMLKDDEVYQFYLAAEARGTGAAMVLMRAAEMHLAAQGSTAAWLSCAIGNERAARFYEKAGWHRARTMIDHTETSEGTFPIETWRYEKVLAG